MKTLYEISLDMALTRAEQSPGNIGILVAELDFTATHRANEHADMITRELACLWTQLPNMLLPMQGEDLLAGRVCYPLVNFSPEPGGLGYNCRANDIMRVADAAKLGPQDRQQVDDMLAYWRTRTTAAKTRQAYRSAVSTVLPTDAWTTASGMAFPLYRMAGIMLDYDKLLRLGIPGLRQELVTRCNNATSEAAVLIRGMDKALDLVELACAHYAGQADAMSVSQTDPNEKKAMRTTAAILRRLPSQPPQTLHEAVQLVWLFTLLAGTWNYGRMDIYLGPFLAADLAAGRTTHDQALQLFQNWWRLMFAYNNQYNNRVIVGGVGRPNEADADVLALLAIEATRTVCLNQPQLTLRFHTKQNPALYAAGMQAIGQGRTFPLLYNDDVNVPAVMNAFDVPRSEAEHYLPFGCGEYILNHRSVGTPNGVINLTKCLEVTLHNGMDPITGNICGLATGALRNFDTFDQLWDAYRKQVQYHVDALAEQQRVEYAVTASEIPFLLISLLFDDCLSNGRPILDGGARYLGGTLETYGNTNASDSLTAIQELVYRRKQYTLDQIVQACDADFNGYEAMRRDLLAAPKYGNDDPIADAMAVKVHEHICNVTKEAACHAGLDSYLVVIINNWANAIFGITTAASPDGRHLGQTLANANNPAPGMDQNGPTAMLNSLVKLDPALHAGAVQNMKFSRGLFGQNRPILDALLGSYFDGGGAQAMITVVDKADLESAVKEPAKWGHLMVRVGGFSARFIDLPVEAQRDVLQRTLY